MRTSYDKAQDLAAIDTAMAELNTAFQAASAEMYAQSLSLIHISY